MTLRDLHDAASLSELAQEFDGQPVPGLRMSEQEFHDWCDPDVRAEWVDGEVILLSPVNVPEFRLNLWLCNLLSMVAGPDVGEVFGIEVQIRLPSIKQRRNPDVFFVARSRANIVKHNFVDGAPDLIMEIVSPDSESRDWRDKYIDYEKSGVREYWVIDPSSRRVEAYTLGREKKYRRIKEVDGRVGSKVLRKLFIRPEWLWKTPLPKVSAILKQLGVRG